MGEITRHKIRVGVHLSNGYAALVMYVPDELAAIMYLGRQERRGVLSICGGRVALTPSDQGPKGHRPSTSKGFWFRRSAQDLGIALRRCPGIEVEATLDHDGYRLTTTEPVMKALIADATEVSPAAIESEPERGATDTDGIRWLLAELNAWIAGNEGAKAVVDSDGKVRVKIEVTL